MTMRRQPMWCAALVVLTVLAALVQFAPGQAGTNGDTQILDRQRGYQARARRLMQELLEGVLRTQMKQLEENQMVNLPLYGHLKEMKARSADLVRKRMTAAVNLLTEARAARGDDRTKLYKAAQKEMHEILVSILAERERLRLRRQLAELVDRTRFLIATQKAIHTETLGLNDENERAVATAIQSQKALGLLCVSLDKVLKVAADQAGDLGSLAAEAGRTLRSAGVADAMARAAGQLTTTEFIDAGKTQQAIIVDLEKVLAALQIRTRSSLLLAQEQVTKLLERQETLRNTVRTGQFTDAGVTQWIAEQGSIADSLRGLIVLVGTNETCTRLTDIAIAAFFRNAGWVRFQIDAARWPKTAGWIGRVLASPAFVKLAKIEDGVLRVPIAEQREALKAMGPPASPAPPTTRPAPAGEPGKEGEKS